MAYITNSRNNISNSDQRAHPRRSNDQHTQKRLRRCRTTAVPALPCQGKPSSRDADSSSSNTDLNDRLSSSTASTIITSTTMSLPLHRRFDSGLPPIPSTSTLRQNRSTTTSTTTIPRRSKGLVSWLQQLVWDSARSPAVAMALCLMLVCLVVPSYTFNIDLESAIIHEGMPNSSFGYSVAQHIDQSTFWLLIGAPRAQTRQPAVQKGGAVYRCKTDRINSCQQVPFDIRGNNIQYSDRLMRYLPTEEKSNQWFGATLKSSPENGVIVACAPRYVYFGSDLNKREPVGMCYVAKGSTTQYEKYSPCSRGISGFEGQGFCQAGFSAALSKDGRRLMISAPGSWYWQGQLYNFKTNGRGRIFAKTPQGNESEDDTYMGYSSAIGKFDGDEIDDYVVGVPKGSDYAGMIEMYSQNMTLLGNLTGDQIGSYFGGSLAVTDINADRLDDIIVGAPFYTNFEEAKSWDMGRVYIFYQSRDHKFTQSKRDILDGKDSQSRFGMALSALGDINYDGYNDLCVGAPYAGKDKTGAIYIFHGSKRGIITEASQVIYASDFNTPLSTFGAAISAGIDQDQNRYPDILVGAYGSDKAVFLKTRPVVEVFASLRLEPEKVNLEIKNFTAPDGTKGSRLKLNTCFKYDGIGLPTELYFDLEWVLDVKENNKSNAEQRAFYTDNPRSYTLKETHNLEKNKTFCTYSSAFVKSEPGDKLSPIRTNLNFKLNLEKSQRKKGLQPILDAHIPMHTSFTVQILKNCGEDEICIPDLFVTYIGVDREHTAGSKEELEVLIIVGNDGEDSFNTKLYITMPLGVDYSGKSGERSDTAITCDPLSVESRYVVCNLGNPMVRGAKSEFTFRVKPNNSNKTRDSLDFILHVNSSNPEAAGTYGNNQVTYSIPVRVDTKINLFGSANPENLNVTQDIKDGRGRLVRHVFVVNSHGTSPINETEVQILWPGRDKEGRLALALDGPLKIEGNGKCEILIVTPKNYSLPSLAYSTKDVNVLYRPGNRDEEETKSRSIRCSRQYCTVIQCLVGYMAPYSTFSLTVHSRLKIKNFTEGRRITDDSDIRLYQFTSLAHARVRSVPYNFKKVDNSKFPVERLQLTTNLNLDYFGSEGGVAPWIYIVAISVGILLLLLLILLLWCCGFFKRKKPDEDEGYFAVNGKNDIDNKIVD